MNQKINNRWPIELLSNHRWPVAELRAMSEHLDRKASLTKNSNHSIIKTTAEEIVRKHREERKAYLQMKEIEKERPISTFQAYRVIPQVRPSFFRRIVGRVNWNNILNWTCWGLVIGCLIYLGIFIFAPFTLKFIWK
jgi:hypothetical protein